MDMIKLLVFLVKFVIAFSFAMSYVQTKKKDYLFMTSTMILLMIIDALQHLLNI